MSNQPTLTPQGYPADWPKPCKLRPNSLISKITDEEKRKLYNRELTTRALAAQYRVKETWVSTLFPGKVQALSVLIKNKKILTKARKEFRTAQAALVIAGELSTVKAAEVCRVSYRSMARAVQHLRLETGVVEVPAAEQTQEPSNV